MRRSPILAILAWAICQPACAASDMELDQHLAARLTWTEDFTNTARGAFSGDLEAEVDGPWTTDFVDGALRYTNTTDSASVRYYSFAKVRFEGKSSAYPSDGTQPSAIVKVEQTQNGAAGLMVGYPGGGDYLMFAIGARDQYLIFEKHEGKLKRLDLGSDPAIRDGEYNNLAVSQDGGRMAFKINGELVYEIERPELSDSPVGIAVAGKGTFLFDEVAISANSRVMASYNAGCYGVAAPGSNDLIVLASVYDGAAISSVTLAGQDVETSVVDIDVEAGPRPVYIVAAAKNSVVWRVRGAVERVSHFVSIDARGSKGVVGLPADRVEFETGCIKPFGEADWWAPFAVVSKSFGRVVDVVAYDYSPAAIGVPSGAVVEGKDVEPEGIVEGAESHVLVDALRFNPGGVAQIDPKAVVSTKVAEPYEVLPHQWGLIQLIKEGKLARIDHYNGGGAAYLILGPMRFPPSLGGAHSVDFVLPHGTPMPTGRPVHSDVIVEGAPSP